MIISLSTQSDIADKHLEFMPSSTGGISYYATLQHIHKICPNKEDLDAIIIPYSINGNDNYEFRSFVYHIRTEIDDFISHTPILIYITEVEIREWQYFNEYEFTIYSRIGTKATAKPSITDIETARDDLDDEALDDYKKKAVAYPRSDTGRHDMSNMWGSYVLLKTLHLLDPDNADFKKKCSCLKGKLVEDPYYKNIIQNMGDDVSKKQLESLKKKAQLHCTSKNKILIVEDQLTDGWEDAYLSFFHKDTEILFAKTIDEVKQLMIIPKNYDIDLVLLDVRLSEEDRNFQDESGYTINALSGIKLAKWIRTKSKLPTVPIIAATASNKSWTLEALLDNGINDYWIKASPEIFDTTALAVRNVKDLYQKIKKVMEWSEKTGEWQKELYRIADVVNEEDEKIASRLFSKTKSLQALMFRSFSGFSKELSEGLQFNLAFLQIYSCLNDLAEWVCTIEDLDDGTSKWWLQGDTRETPLVDRKLCTTKSNGKKIFKWHIQDGDNFYASTDFPDTSVIKKILINKGLDFESFKELSKIRNGLPLIHGKENLRASGSAEEISILTEDIDKLVSLLGELVNHHVEALKPL